MPQKSCVAMSPQRKALYRICSSKMFADGRPITAQEYNALTALRMENTGKVRGVFDVNFDKQEFSAVHIMDGWQTWAMRDVSAAVYHPHGRNSRRAMISGASCWII